MSRPSRRIGLRRSQREALRAAYRAFREGTVRAWRVESPPLRRARSDTQAAGGQGRDSQRPVLRLGGRSLLIWSSWSSVLQTDRSTKSTNSAFSRAGPQTLALSCDGLPGVGCNV